MRRETSPLGIIPGPNRRAKRCSLPTVGKELGPKRRSRRALSHKLPEPGGAEVGTCNSVSGAVPAATQPFVNLKK